MARTVLITGGSRGIGQACVETFARNGDSVVFLYRANEAAAQSVVSKLAAEGIRVQALRCDITSPADIRAALAEIRRTYHHIDVLVNNAGISHVGLFTDMTDSELDLLLNADLRGAMILTREVLPGMISDKHGCIVNIASMWGEVGASCEVAYSAAKAGIIGFTKALAKEVGLSGIRVNCVSPGLIATDMNAHLSDEDIDALVEQIPLGRIGQPEDVARACLFLCSDNASYITGQVLNVNGGMVI